MESSSSNHNGSILSSRRTRSVVPSTQPVGWVERNSEANHQESKSTSTTKYQRIPQELSETQLHTDTTVENLSRKPLGFTRALLDARCLQKVLFFYDLDVLGGIRSTQPTAFDFCRLFYHKNRVRCQKSDSIRYLQL